jgi:hypothetical protein
MKSMPRYIINSKSYREFTEGSKREMTLYLYGKTIQMTADFSSKIIETRGNGEWST